MAKVNPYVRYLSGEDKLQKAVIDYVKYSYPDAFIVHIPNEGKRSRFEQFKFKFLGAVAGMPDVMIYNSNIEKNGLAIELKYGYNKPTAKQKECMKRLENCNWYVFWSNDFDNIKEKIDNYFNNVGI